MVNKAAKQPKKRQAETRAIEIEMLAPQNVNPDQRNARTHSPAQIDQIIAAIREWGFTNPVLIDEQARIIAGHARREAALQIGIPEIPCIRIVGLTEDRRRALMIADNQIALNAGWDEKMLAAELVAIGDLAALVGFNESELARLMGARSPGLTDPDAAPATPVDPVTAPGDVWLMGRHRLCCGDSTDKTSVAAALGRITPALMVTDPPYGVAYDAAWRINKGLAAPGSKKLGKVANDHRDDWRAAWRLFSGDVAYVWHGGHSVSVVQESLEAADFEIRAHIIWAKDQFAISRGDYHWRHESCWYVVRRGRTAGWTGDRKQSTVWEISARGDKGHGHSTQKPVEIMKRPIENNSSPGQAVYDPFVGSGTTIIAAEITGRACHALELEPAYCDVAVKRWQDFTGKHATLEKTGDTFAETSVDRMKKPAKKKTKVAAAA